MMKKSLICISVFCILAIICSPVFASSTASDAENTLNNIKDGVQNMVNNAGNAMGDMKNGVSNMINDGENDVKDGSRDVENGVSNAENDMSRSINPDRNTSGYTATRTGTTDMINGNSNTWTVWVVLAIAGVLIIALVWYYGMQTQGNSREHY